MPKLLNGKELAEFIKERQAKQVRSLKGVQKITPSLAIVQVKDDPVINTYVRLKKAYGREIGVEVEVYRPPQAEIAEVIEKLNGDKEVNGIIVQLPLEDPTQTEETVNLVIPSKDVDALALKSDFQPATPTAILWLLAAYNVELKGKKVLLIGKGKLVGEPLYKILKTSGIDVEIVDRTTKDLSKDTIQADVIITATGNPAILYPNMLKHGAVIVDAGVASENGKTVGDLDESVYQREDLLVTPKIGGVGPLTVCSLFENVIHAAQLKR